MKAYQKAFSQGFENNRNICDKFMCFYLVIFTTTHVVFGLKF